MKIFIDTNIFLDLILQREGFKEASMILNSCQKDIFQGFISDITLLNIDYIAKKQTANINEFLKIINSIFTIVGANNKSFTLALDIQNNDLEDNIQYICANTNNCDLIITNDKAFYKENIKTLNSVDFVNQYIK